MWQCTPTRSTDGDRRMRVDGAQRVAVAEVEAELRVVLPGGDELVGVGVDARRDPQPGPTASGSPSACERVEPVELVEAVDHDVANAGS